MKRIIPIIIILAAVAGGYWWYTQNNTTVAALETEGPKPLVGSGSIEAETVAITAELGGRIIELMVDEGEEVKANQVLVELDKSDLLAQQLQLEAALATAKANLESVSAPPRPEDIAVAKAQLQQAQVGRDGAKMVWEALEALVNDPKQLEAQISQAKAQVTEAEKGLEMAQVSQKRADIQAEAASRNQSDHAALVQAEVAQKQLDAANIGIQIAEVSLEGAKKQVAHLTRMRDEPLFLETQANTAEAAYKQAEAAVLMAQARPANSVFYLVDKQGRVFKRARVQEMEGIPLITGIDRKDYLTRKEGCMKRILRAINLFETYTARPGRPRIGEIHVDTLEGIILYTASRAVQIRLGWGHFTKKLDHLDRLLAVLAQRGRQPSIIRLDNSRNPKRVTVKLADVGGAS